MKVVGLTGGIGSGKTTVAGFFSELGVPVYIADVEARKLQNESPEIKERIIAIFGTSAYKEDILDRTYISGKVFNDPELFIRRWRHISKTGKRNRLPRMLFMKLRYFSKKAATKNVISPF